MVQFLLSRWLRLLAPTIVIVAMELPGSWLLAAPREKPTTVESRVPELLMDGGRRLTFVRTISSERDVSPKPGFFTKVFNFVVGAPDFHYLVRPYEVVTDSRGRMIVTDPGAQGIHIFDFTQRRYKFVSRRDKGNDPMLSPQCIALDDKDNFYVTDSDSGKIFVFDADGKYRHALGSLKGGEGYFKRPTGIAVDSSAQRIYVSDTLRNKIFVLDMQGSVLKTIGQTGESPGEFNFPTELRLAGHDLLVVDAMNFRVQAFGPDAEFRYALGTLGDQVGAVFRPKGIAVDSEGDVYVVEGTTGMVQVFNRQGQLLYYFGQKGTKLGEFRLPTGLFIDAKDRVYVVDSFNARVQVFQYYGLKSATGAAQ